ncbi:hypothetical protein [Treponema sp. R6D11]
MKFEEEKMVHKKNWFGVLGFILVIGLFLSGCATKISTAKATDFDKRRLKWEQNGTPKYTILGSIVLEKKWFGILGFSTPTVPFVPSIDLYIYQYGGVTYADLLNEAKKKYPEADAVVDIRVEYTGDLYWIFYASRKNIFSGIAIKYSRSEVDYPPEKEKNDLIDFLKK